MTQRLLGKESDDIVRVTRVHTTTTGLSDLIKMTSFILCSPEEIRVFHTLDLLTEFVEPVDVMTSEYEAFDSAGTRYSLLVRKESRRGLWGLGKTIVDVTHAESIGVDIPGFIDRVGGFIERLAPGNARPTTPEEATSQLIERFGYCDDPQ